MTTKPDGEKRRTKTVKKLEPTPEMLHLVERALLDIGSRLFPGREVVVLRDGAESPASTSEEAYERSNAADATVGHSERQPPRLVSLAQLREKSGLSERWWRYRINEGMPTHRYGSQLRFDVSEVFAWLEERDDARLRCPDAVQDEPSRRPLFTTESLASYLCVSPRTVRRILGEGEIPSYKIGGARRIDPDDVDRYLEARRVGRTPNSDA